MIVNWPDEVNAIEISNVPNIIRGRQIIEMVEKIRLNQGDGSHSKVYLDDVET